MDWQAQKESEEQQRILETGGNQTVFSVSHSDIKRTGKSQCQVHKWRKLNDIELECTICPTIIICGLDDERLLMK